MRLVAETEKQRLLDQLCSQIPEEFIRAELCYEEGKHVLKLKIDLLIKSMEEGGEEDGSKS